MTSIHIIGASSLVGDALLSCLSSGIFADSSISIYSRRSFSRDLLQSYPISQLADNLRSSRDKHYIVSLAPIKILRETLVLLTDSLPSPSLDIAGLIALSTTSAQTKRYAFSPYDKNYVTSVLKCEDDVTRSCLENSIKFYIVRPSLVYGCSGSAKDKNLSRIASVFRYLPFVLFPSGSGLRQPIHAFELASAIHCLMQSFIDDSIVVSFESTIALGGNSALSYRQMLGLYLATLSPGDMAKKCKIIIVNNRILHFICSPLLLFNPRAFEAILRMQVDLAGFTPVSALIPGCNSSFPVLPI